MPVFRVQVFYQHGLAEKWSNVWHLSADSLLEGRDGFVSVAVPILLSLLDPTCTLTKILVSDPVSPDFSEVVINSVGTHFGSGSLLPLFNRVKALFQPAALGRPDYKFLGGLVGEDNSGNGTLGTTVPSDIDAILTGLIEDMATNATPLCSENNQLWVTVAVQTAIQMRQLHRKRKKATAPAP